MDIPDSLQCFFSAQVIEQGGSYVIEIPKQEIADGDLECDAVYRTALLATPTETADSITQTEPETKDSPTAKDTRAKEPAGPTHASDSSEPPVQTGEVREVEIETIGDQGDGIARVERGYVIIVPETEKGDQVTIELTTVRENVAFGEVVESDEHTP